MSEPSKITDKCLASREADIQAWCRVCGADREIPDLITASRSAESMYVE